MNFLESDSYIHVAIRPNFIATAHVVHFRPKKDGKICFQADTRSNCGGQSGQAGRREIRTPL